MWFVYTKALIHDKLSHTGLNDEPTETSFTSYRHWYPFFIRYFQFTPSQKGVISVRFLTSIYDNFIHNVIRTDTQFPTYCTFNGFER
jgi:hypothetical protein